MNTPLLSLLLALPVMAYSQSDSLTTRAVVAPRQIAPLPTYRPGFALMLSAGTTGIGLGIGHSINRHVGVRVGANLFTYIGTTKSGKTTDNVQMGIDYKAKLQSANLMLDIYPFKRTGFRLTGGAFYNLNQITFFGMPAKTVTFNDISFTPTEVGTLDGKVNFAKIAPYAGIGFGNPYTRSRVKFMLDIGFFAQQSPQVTLVSTGLLEPSSDQGAVIQDNLRALKYYPVASFGISYKL